MKLIAIIFLFFLSSVVVAGEAISDSTTTNNVNLIAGGSVGGSSGGRVTVKDFKKIYNGAVTVNGDRISWPYIYTTRPIVSKCNISSGQCTPNKVYEHYSERTQFTYKLSPGGLLRSSRTSVYNGFQSYSSAGSEILIFWAK